MTKAELISEIAAKTGVEKATINITVEALINTIKSNLQIGHNVYLRGRV